MNTVTKEKLDVMCRKRGMRQTTLMSRLVDWFFDQDEYIQTIVLQTRDRKELDALTRSLRDNSEGVVCSPQMVPGDMRVSTVEYPKEMVPLLERGRSAEYRDKAQCQRNRTKASGTSSRAQSMTGNPKRPNKLTPPGSVSI